MTVAGVRALAGAGVVFYDALVNPALLRGARPGAELVYVGKRAGNHAQGQREIEARMVEAARAGALVVRLKGGDPFVFGRGGEEALACREAGIPFTIVPGISSAIAGPAYAGIPVTHRGVSASFMVVTASGADQDSVDWKSAAGAGTLVILMGATGMESAMAKLVEHGLAPMTPAAAIRWATRPNQQLVTGTVATLPGLVRDAGLEAPLVTVVGEVAGLAGSLSWFEAGPLAGKRIVVTRARAQASELAERFAALGADVIEAPVIATIPRAGDEGLQGALAERWDWAVFTSANGVDAAFAALAECGRDARAFAGTNVAVIGEATARALLRHGLRADFVPSLATSSGLAGQLPLAQGARVLIPHSSLSEDELAAGLRARGAAVTQLVAYDTVRESLDETRRGDVLSADAITFASASSARNLKEALGDAELTPATRLVSIGPKTSGAVAEHFGRVDAEARTADVDALVTATMEALTWDS
jgi:uroporphyrinogen III methyltransferase/synthase